MKKYLIRVALPISESKKYLAISKALTGIGYQVSFKKNVISEYTLPTGNYIKNSTQRIAQIKDEIRIAINEISEESEILIVEYSELDFYNLPAL